VVNTSLFYRSNSKIDTLTQALHGVHERGIIHRDISHANVVFTTAAQDASMIGGEHGTTILLDFDLATDEYKVRGTSQEPWGTKGYVAPETLQCGEVSCKSDMWSAGALLAYQVCQCSAPFTSCGCCCAQPF
jgi:serine/threonine protein kinase